MELNLKYECGKTYYYNKLIRIPDMIICELCDDDGNLIQYKDQKKILCPLCGGVGKYEGDSGSLIEEVVKC